MSIILWSSKLGDVTFPVPVGGAGSSLSQTRDPLSTDTGFGPGTIWYNSTPGAQRWWECVSLATAASASWVFSGAAYASGGSNPNVEVTQFGSATIGSPFSTFGEEGNLVRLVGNPIAGNGADTTLDILGGIALPALSFDGIGNRGLCIQANGKFGATVSGNVVISLYVNPTMSGQTVTNGAITGGQVTGVGTGALIGTQALASGANLIAAGGWSSVTEFFKYGVAGSNTQYSQSYFVNSVTATTPHAGMQAPIFTTQPENAVMNIVLAASSSNSTANETILNLLQINAMN